MALDTKLKSEMGNHFAAETESQREVILPVPPVSSVEPEKPTEPKRPVNAEIPPNTGTPRWKEPQEAVPKEEPIRPSAAKTNETEDLLKSIEKQLRTLNQSVANLGQEIENCKHPDYQTIFSRIDAARSSIVKAVSGISDAKSEESDGAMLDKMTELEELIREIGQKQDRNDRQMTQTLRENANFQIQVRQNMQRELDEFRGKQNGEQFNPILKLIAAIYVDYQGLLEDDTITGRSKKNLKALFEDMEELMSEYDAEIICSEVGTVRRSRGNKIIEKILTGDETKHNTIAVSRRPGVMRDRVVLSPEFVDVFVYDPSMAAVDPVEEQPSENAAEEPVQEPEKDGEDELAQKPVREETGDKAEQNEAESEPAEEEIETEDQTIDNENK